MENFTLLNLLIRCFLAILANFHLLCPKASQSTRNQSRMRVYLKARNQRKRAKISRVNSARTNLQCRSNSSVRTQLHQIWDKLQKVDARMEQRKELRTLHRLISLKKIRWRKYLLKLLLHLSKPSRRQRSNRLRILKQNTVMIFLTGWPYTISTMINHTRWQEHTQISLLLILDNRINKN